MQEIAFWKGFGRPQKIAKDCRHSRKSSTTANMALAVWFVSAAVPLLFGYVFRRRAPLLLRNWVYEPLHLACPVHLTCQSPAASVINTGGSSVSLVDLMGAKCPSLCGTEACCACNVLIVVSCARFKLTATTCCRLAHLVPRQRTSRNHLFGLCGLYQGGPSRVRAPVPSSPGRWHTSQCSISA